MAKLTKVQAMALVENEIKPLIKEMDAAWAVYDGTMPKLTQLNKKLEETLKKAESAEMVETLITALKGPMRKLAPAAVSMAKLLKRVNDLLKENDGIMEVISSDMVNGVKDVSDQLEKARNGLRTAKQLCDQGEEFIASQRRNDDSAGEEWSIALTGFDAMYDGCKEEAKAVAAWESEAKAAHAARDKARLDKAQKAVPACKNMDGMTKLPKGKPFEDFDKRFDVDALGSDLQDEISLDRGKAMNEYEKAMAMVEARDAAVQRVKALAIEPRDGRKALTTLKFPAGAQAKLQAVIDGPEAAMAKALEALAKTFKVNGAGTGKEMVAALSKAGVI